MQKIDTLPKFWKHHSGRMYKLLQVTNEHGDRTPSWPVTAVCEDPWSRVWSRPLDQFLVKFEPCKPPEFNQLPRTK